MNYLRHCDHSGAIMKKKYESCHPFMFELRDERWWRVGESGVSWWRGRCICRFSVMVEN